MLTLIEQLIRLADVWCEATGTARGTLSSKVLGRGSRLSEIADGADIGSRQIERVVQYISDHWPDGHPWPADLFWSAPPNAGSGHPSAEGGKRDGASGEVRPRGGEGPIARWADSRERERLYLMNTDDLPPEAALDLVDELMDRITDETVRADHVMSVVSMLAGTAAVICNADEAALLEGVRQAFHAALADEADDGRGALQ